MPDRPPGPGDRRPPPWATQENYISRQAPRENYISQQAPRRRRGTSGPRVPKRPKRSSRLGGAGSHRTGVSVSGWVRSISRKVRAPSFRPLRSEERYFRPPSSV